MRLGLRFEFEFEFEWSVITSIEVYKGFRVWFRVWGV